MLVWGERGSAVRVVAAKTLGLWWPRVSILKSTLNLLSIIFLAVLTQV